MDLTRVGTTADAVVAAGVNQIDGIGFGLKDPTAAENRARQLAVRALQGKAALYAQALGVDDDREHVVEIWQCYSVPSKLGLVLSERYRM